MARTSTRTPEEIEQLVAGYKQSGLSRQQYCEQQGISVATLDYYRHRQRKGPRVTQKPSSLVRVKLKAGASLDKHKSKSFTVALANGRRIEIENNTSIVEQDLARLIRIVEAA